MTLEVVAKHIERARTELRKQRQRNMYFLNSQIFGDPAWELVLEAYIATSENRCVVLSDLSNDLRRTVPIVTRLALIMEAEGCLERCRSHDNRDLRCVQLTVDAVAWCEQCLDLKSDDGDYSE
jgi:DNA-binding MarR family transcriptional regulator